MKGTCLTGQVFSSKGFGDFIVVDHKNWRNVKVKFLDTGYETITRVDKVQTGSVRDKLMPNTFGVGILGDKGFSTEDRQHSVWTGMLQRCYCPKYQSLKPSYIGCSVSDFFKKYDNFHVWCENQVGFDNIGWHLDKDILVKGNKVYSEDVCVFVPQEINSAFTTSKRIRGETLIGLRLDKRSGKFQARLSRGGKSVSLGYFDTELEGFKVYKEAKEVYLKELAEKWKGAIDTRVYEALISYQVEITD